MDGYIRSRPVRVFGALNLVKAGLLQGRLSRADQLKLKIRLIESEKSSNLDQSDIVGTLFMRTRQPMVNLSTYRAGNTGSSPGSWLLGALQTQRELPPAQGLAIDAW